MSGRKFIRFALTMVVLAGILAGGLGLRFGVRHRHDGGDAAHSHGSVFHSHGTTRFHTHSHDHARGHSHSHLHLHSGEHMHSHANSKAEAESTKDELAESHVHVTIFGFELTLPDFGFSEPAPLVDSGQSTDDAACEGHIVELSSPFALSNVLRFWMDQTAISVGILDVSDTTCRHELVFSSPDRKMGRDASRPLVPPPRTGLVIQLC